VAIGPVQLLVLGFNHPDLPGEIVAELERLRHSGTVRVIDSLAVFKDAAGEFEVAHLGDDEGRVIGALVGLGVDPFSDDSGWDVLEDIPNDTAAALVLLEHHWAVPLRDAIVRAGGFRISDGFISPLDLVEIGLISADGPDTLRAIDETGVFASRRVVSRR
jgi:hypothetical protein